MAIHDMRPTAIQVGGDGGPAANQVIRIRINPRDHPHKIVEILNRLPEGTRIVRCGPRLDTGEKEAGVVLAQSSRFPPVPHGEMAPELETRVFGGEIMYGFIVVGGEKLWV